MGAIVDKLLERGPLHQLLAAGLLILGMACLIFVIVFLARDLAIWVFGRHVMADVVDKWAEPMESSSPDMPQFQYFVRYRFTASNGQVVSHVASMSANQWSRVAAAGGMEAGGQVAVVYFPLYPEHNRPDDSRIVSILACAYIPFILFGIGCLWASRRTFRPVESLQAGE